MRLMVVLIVVSFAGNATENSLTSAEKKDGWKLLFDGKTMKGWRDPAKRNPPGDAWAIEDGCLKTRLKPIFREDLISAESYGNFELMVDWRLSPGANTGLKYRLQRVVFMDDTKMQKGPGGFEAMLGREIENPRSDRTKMVPGATSEEYTVGFEFQLIDDQRHADAMKDARHMTGALYSMIAPSTKTAPRPAGEWNQARLLVRGNQVEHRINGIKVLDAALDSQAVREGVAKRWGKVPSMYKMLTNPKPRGPIALQHHADEVWFRNVKVRSLDSP